MAAKLESVLERTPDPPAIRPTRSLVQDKARLCRLAGFLGQASRVAVLNSSLAATEKRFEMPPLLIGKAMYFFRMRPNRGLVPKCIS